MAKHVIFDNGSGWFKAGLSGDQSPRITFPCVVGRPKGQAHGEATAVGQEAWDKRGELDVTFPNRRGIITNWEDMERIWKHAYEKLGVEAKNHKVLIAEVSLNPKADRERIMKIFFEKFNVPAMYLAQQAVLALYAAGQEEGTVVDCGTGVTQVVPVKVGFAVPSAVTSMDLGGREVDEKLMSVISEKGFSFSPEMMPCCADGMDVAKSVKENICYVAEDFDAEMKKSCGEVEKAYTGPDGKEIKLAQERFRCPEVLFQPKMGGVESDGVHKLAYDAIMKVEEGVRERIYKKIIIAGGGSLFPGFPERFMKEFKKLAPDLEVDVIAPPARNISTFIGGSILASLPTFEPLWATRQQYDEGGAAIVHTKCE